MTSTVVLDNLGKAFGPVPVVDRLHLALRPGEFLSLLGPSGCGKTTTLRMIAGFVQPSAGRVLVNGQVLSAPGATVAPERRGMSMIFQSYALWPNMTVAQNVAFGLRMRRVGAAERRDRVARMLEVVHLSHLAGRYPSELSGGQQQRVSLARAMVVRPGVLLLDEPLSNLDANLREEMRTEIRRLHDEFGTTSVYVTHDQSEAMAVSDRIAVMNNGRIEQVDDPQTLYAQPRTRFVAEFMGRSNILRGTSDGRTVRFDGWDAELPGLQPGAHSFSLRPQDVRLAAEAPGSGSFGSGSSGSGPEVCVVPAVVVARSYLGDAWEYVVRPASSGSSIRALVPPGDAPATGSEAWLCIGSRHLHRVEDA